ncbi:MAG: LysR family transcriptional regulator, partial [Burkholderiales bacterium]
YAMGRACCPACFAKRAEPKKPQDLTQHDAVNLRLPAYGRLYAWDFEGCALRVEAQLAVRYWR